MNCEKVFNFLVEELEKYLKENNLQAMILGISGGIDSTVVAAICHEVSNKTGIPLIGRGLPTKFNKDQETCTANKVGFAFCTDYDVIGISHIYHEVLDHITSNEKFERTKLANGNIQARLRMILLYDLASLNRGIVMDTDNLTENNLGYYTIHGDQGDYNPIHCLWKTEVFELAAWLAEKYGTDIQKEAIKRSLELKPTAGLGITDSDLDEIGANSYEEVDSILKVFIEDKDENSIRLSILREKFGDKIVDNVLKRHKASEFKRKGLPIYPKIENKN